MTLTPERLAELRALAERATPGPWEEGLHLVHAASGVLYDDREVCETTLRVDTAFIAAFDPTTAIALLDALDAARTEADQATRLHREVCGIADEASARVFRLVAERDAARKESEEARGLLGRIVKYVTEDRAKTPGSTRLARVVPDVTAFLSRTPEGSKPCGDAGKTGGG